MGFSLLCGSPHIGSQWVRSDTNLVVLLSQTVGYCKPVLVGFLQPTRGQVAQLFLVLAITNTLVVVNRNQFLATDNTTNSRGSEHVLGPWMKPVHQVTSIMFMFDTHGCSPLLMCFVECVAVRRGVFGEISPLFLCLFALVKWFKFKIQLWQ